MKYTVGSLIAAACAGKDSEVVCAVLKRVPTHAIKEAIASFEAEVADRASIAATTEKSVSDEKAEAKAEVETVKAAVADAKATAKVEADEKKEAVEAAKEAAKADAAKAKSESKPVK